MNIVASADGTTLALERQGEGNVIILVGGALDSGERSFALFTQLAARLAKAFTILTYDRRGRGESGDTSPYTVEREIEDSAALIESAGGSASLYGFSSGAALALRAAAALGSAHVTKLALYEPPYGVSAEEGQAFSRYTARTNALLEAGRYGDAVHEFLSDMLPAETLASMRQSPAWASLETLAPTLVYDNAVLGKDGLVPVDTAKTIVVPTLVLYGSSTFAFMQTAAAALTDALPEASQRILEGEDHAVAPETLIPILTEFFKEEKA